MLQSLEKGSFIFMRTNMKKFLLALIALTVLSVPAVVSADTWFPSTIAGNTYLRPASAVWGLQIPGLINCTVTKTDANGVFSCGTGGTGGTGGTWSTTTSQTTGVFVNYPNNTTDVVNIGSTSTTTGKFYFDPNTSFAKIGGQLLISGSTTLQNFTGVQATTTNFFSPSGTFTNLFGTNITGFGLGSCTGTSALTFSGTTFGCAAQPQGTVTSVTSANGDATVATQTTTPVITIVSAPKLDTGRTLAITGDLSWTSPSFDGSGNVTAAGTLATVNGNVGSFGGTNSIPNFTVNGKGLITAAGVNTPSIPASEITSGTFGTGSYTFPANLTIAGNATTTAFAITSLGVPAGTFLAVNPQGSVIATTTPAGSSGVTSVATTNGITGGTITTTGTIQLDQTFGQVNTAASTTYVGGVTIGKATTTQATSTNQFATTGTFTNLTGTSFTGFGLTSCSGSTFLQWSGGTFACGTPSGSGGTDLNWSFFNNSGIRVATTTNNVLIGASATTSIARLDVIEPSTKYVATFDAANAGAGSAALIQIGGRSGIGATNLNDLKNDGSGNFSIQTGSATLDTEGTDRLSITKTGAATFSGTLTSTGLFTGTVGLQANASSTFQNFTFVNATGTQATTTTLSTTNASTTNLVVSSAGGTGTRCAQFSSTGVLSANVSGCGSGGGGTTWNTVTGTSQTAAVNNAYITNNAALVTVTLPTTAAVGDIVQIVGRGAGLWKIAQSSGQTIHFGNQDTTTGATGNLTALNRYDVVQVVCTIANTDFTVISSIGNINVN